MPEPTALTYPDILGTITGGERFEADAVQMALAVRPRVVRAGRPFEAVLLLQNSADTTVEIHGKLLLPEEDSQKKPGRFSAGSEPLLIHLRPAEVGYAVLPITVQPDAAPGSAYKIAIAIDVTPASEAAIISRSARQSSLYLPPETNIRLMELKSLAFSAARRGLFGNVIEAPFSVLPAQTSPVLQPDWVSLWSPGDYADYRALVERHRDALLGHILPELQSEAVYTALYPATRHAFSTAGYPIQEAETTLITRLLVSVLWMAAFPGTAVEYPGEEIYHVRRLLEQAWPHDSSMIPLPNWCRSLLEQITPQTAARPMTALAESLYGDLLSDAISHGFHLLYTITRQELGSEDDMREYGAQLISMIQRPNAGLSFVDVYLPLVLGGLIVEAKAGALNADMLQNITTIVHRQKAERGVQDSFILELMQQVLDWAEGKTDNPP